MSGSNVVHRDVAYNLMAWCYCSVGAIPDGLDMLRMSWKINHPPKSLFVYFIKELIQKHYQFNSAKLHALVILYNVWFTRKQLRFQFCFQCLVLLTRPYQHVAYAKQLHIVQTIVKR